MDNKMNSKLWIICKQHKENLSIVAAFSSMHLICVLNPLPIVRQGIYIYTIL